MALLGGLSFVFVGGVGGRAPLVPSVQTPGAIRAARTPCRWVSLTFDDGPHPSFTPQILDVLKAKGVHATFFMLGRQAERYPDLVRRIVAEGHAVANHTWDHPDLRTLDEAGFAAQVDRTNEVLESITGLPVRCARPPFGRADATVQRRLAERGMTSVVWTGDSRDFEKPGPDAIVRSALEGLQPGGVLLLHDGGGNRDQTIAALPRIIDGLRAAGYRTIPICAPDPHVPTGGVDAVEPAPGRIVVRGWATDPDTSGPVDVHVYVDGAHAATTRTAARSAATAEHEPGTRFQAEARARPGRHEVCVYALNAGPGSSNPQLGCSQVDVAPLSPFDDLRPLVARVRVVQLVAEAQAVRDLLLVHDARRRPWTYDGDALVARALLTPSP